MKRDAATERQVQAARPDMSTWLAANAGSGKTRVLTDRVARLLLEGVEPQHILCLTYTKAAASEMQNRLFKRLGEWAMLTDESLAKALDVLGVEGAISPDRLRQARTLFARAIETPGGLKIQTIHSFCAAVLRQFPLEAGVSPQFSEMEERATTLLCLDILQDFAQGPEAALIDGITQHLTDETLEGFLAGILNNRALFETASDQSTLWQKLGLREGMDEQEMLRSIVKPGDLDVLQRLIPALRSGTATDQKAAAKLAAVEALDLTTLPVLENLLLFGASAKTPFGAKIGAFPTKGLREGAAMPLMPDLEDLMARVEAGRDTRLALGAACKTLSLLNFAAAFLPEYERRKLLRGWLDFDDLILKTRDLLRRPDVAEWVLYRLDGGIDHILVDEAQDTSPQQWVVIESLAREFTSGRGARGDLNRTIFVVGDKKQSIYSFQGADPAEFDRMQTEFSERLSGAGSSLESLTLEHSFRSSAAILRLVDLVFTGQSGAGFTKDALHRAFKSSLPGRVDLWPVIPKSEKEEDQHWTDPVDRPGSQHHTVILAEQIAAQIKSMLNGGATLPGKDPEDGIYPQRPVQAGDILILLQRRSDLFAEIIRACKSAGLPIAGADRLKVGAELAVKDLGALLAFLALPEDSLSLATVLRSPLGGWSEQDLFDLAHRRGPGVHLWKALRDRADAYPQTVAMLQDLRTQADFLRPYDLIERVLTRHRGRDRLLGRLGSEAEDGINALLSQALAYERNEVPSLTGFLVWMETDDLVIKRQAESGGNLIRVMTVHGAKGLEAPIVILPDTAARRAPAGDAIMQVDDLPMWRMPSKDMPELMAEAQESARDKQREERLRLLYVALTRAESWLIVAAAGELSKQNDSWYQMIEAGLQAAGAVEQEFSGGQGLRYSHGDWSGHVHDNAEQEQLDHAPLPDLFLREAEAKSPQPPTLSPSDLGGAKALPGEAGRDEDEAKQRGTDIHLLLQYLPDSPESDWPEIADTLLPVSSSFERQDMLREASTVLRDPSLQDLFQDGTLAEVPFTAKLGERRLHGIIDRLIVTSEKILAVDYKTNVATPDTPENCPEGILRQLGAYSHALRQIYPDHEIETAVLWTTKPLLMPVSQQIVTEALRRSGVLDDKTVAP